MTITEKTIDYVAALAKIKVSSEERDKLLRNLNDILNYVAIMNELDTEGIEPMSHALPLKNVFREDVAVSRDNRDQLLSNAPVKKDDSFVVPKTVE